MNYEDNDVIEVNTSSSSLDDFMNEFGVIEGEVSTDVLTLLKNKGVIIPEHYDIIKISDCYNDDIKEGKAYITEIVSTDETVFDEYGNKTEETETKMNTNLVILDSVNEEVTIIPIKLNPKNVDLEAGIIRNIHCKSKLFSLVRGVAYLRTGDKNAFTEYETLHEIRFKPFFDYVEGLSELRVRVVEVNSGDFHYNSFVFMNEDDY